MSDKLQLLFSLLSLGLVAVAGFLVLRATRPGGAGDALAPLGPVSRPDTVAVWTAWNEASVQFLFKPYLDSTERNDFNNRALSRRLGAPDDAYLFFQLFVINLDSEETFELEGASLSLEATEPGGATHRSLSPSKILADGRGVVTEADRIMAAALGLRDGPYRIPPRTAARYVAAFDGSVRIDSWEDLRLILADGDISLERKTFDRQELDRFLLNPESRLGESSELDVARRPVDPTPADE